MHLSDMSMAQLREECRKRAIQPARSAEETRLRLARVAPYGQQRQQPARRRWPGYRGVLLASTALHAFGKI